MRRFPLLPLCALLALASTALPPLPARADTPAPRADMPFDATVTVRNVDIDRDRVQAADDRGRVYTIDTYQSAITLRTAAQAGQAGDLVPGMRLRVRGTLASPDIVEAKTVQVLPFRPAPAAPAAAATLPETGPVTLRGTVESVDSRRRSLVVRVRSHERTVSLTPQTDLQDVDPANPDHLAYLPGERVTVQGVFQEDGTVRADVVSRKVQPNPRRAPPPADTGDTLVGSLSKQSSRYGSRDIKVRTAAGREETVHVPRGIPIMRDSRLISVHDLAKSDTLRVQGVPEGDSLRATRIDVVRSNDEGL